MLKKKIKYKVKMCLVMCIILSIVLVTGCNNKEKKAEKVQNTSGTVVFQYGDNIITLGEAYIYCNTVKERYQAQYGGDVWQLNLPNGEGIEVPLEDVIKQAVVDEIIKVKTLVAHAENYNVTLTEGKEQIIREEAAKFFEGLTDEDITTMELTEEKVLQVMRENALAKAVEEKILADSPIEVSDEQARMTTFYDMYFDCYTIDADGTVVPFTEEEKSLQYEKALQACSTLATAGIDEDRDAENIEKLAEYYGLGQAKEQILTPEEILEIYGEEVYTILYAMEDGDYSTVVETEYGYHVFQMVALTDQKATNARKEVMTEKKILAAMEEQMTKWQEDIDPDFSYLESVNMDVFNKIQMN